MNALCINRGNYLLYYWEELKRMVKDFVKTYREMLNGAFTPGPTGKPLQTNEQKEELPKYLWI